MTVCKRNKCGEISTNHNNNNDKKLSHVTFHLKTKGRTTHRKLLNPSQNLILPPTRIKRLKRDKCDNDIQGNTFHSHADMENKSFLNLHDAYNPLNSEI